MPASEIQLVCFDLGGVLIRLCDGWDHACALAGVTPSKPMSAEDQRQVVELVHREEIGGLHNGEFFQLTGPLLGLSPDDAHAMADAWLRGAFPGIDDLIDTVNHAGFQTACLSNTNDNHWRAMIDPAHANGLPLARLTHRFASHLVRDRKPNASIYRHVEQATGLPAQAILFFDDAEENVEAARALGWHAVRITDPDDPAAQMTSYLRRHNLL
jgi:putative hydrolase of the HAD superfamily